jgi:hypothetical protein
MRHWKQAKLSLSQKTEIWSRWKSGQSSHEIGRAFGKPHSWIRCVLVPSGGIPPAARRRSRLALTLAEREDISRGIASGSSTRETARRLERDACEFGLKDLVPFFSFRPSAIDRPLAGSACNEPLLERTGKPDSADVQDDYFGGTYGSGVPALIGGYFLRLS